MNLFGLLPHLALSLALSSYASAGTPPELVTTLRMGVGFGELKIMESRVEPGSPGGAPEIRAIARTQPMGWRLFMGLKPVVPLTDGPDQGYYSLRFPLSHSQIQVPFYLIGPEGEISHGVLEVVLTSAEWTRLQPPAPGRLAAANPPKVSYFQVGASFTYLSFMQSGLASYSQLALTPQASVRMPFSHGRARASVNASFALLPLIKSDSISARTLELDGQVRYGWPLGPRARWSFYLNGGLLYRTMFVTDDHLGYHNIAGPLLYPSIRRIWAHGGSAGAYLKLSPIMDGVSFLPLANHELTMGADWALLMRNRHFLTLSADLSAFRMTFSDVELSSLSFALGVKYGL